MISSWKTKFLNAKKDPEIFVVVGALHLLVVGADGRAEVSLERPLLQVNAAPPEALLVVLPLEVLPLCELPGLDTEEEQNGSDEDDAPLPADALVLEDSVVDDGDVEHGEDRDETCHNGPEKELVAPHIDEPLCEVLLGAGLHSEERPPHVNHLPSKEEREPGKTREASSACAEHSITAGTVAIVAVQAKVSVTPSVEHECE